MTVLRFIGSSKHACNVFLELFSSSQSTALDRKNLRKDQLLIMIVATATCSRQVEHIQTDLEHKQAPVTKPNKHQKQAKFPAVQNMFVLEYLTSLLFFPQRPFNSIVQCSHTVCMKMKKRFFHAQGIHVQPWVCILLRQDRIVAIHNPYVCVCDHNNKHKGQLLGGWCAASVCAQL